MAFFRISPVGRIVHQPQASSRLPAHSSQSNPRANDEGDEYPSSNPSAQLIANAYAEAAHPVQPRAALIVAAQIMSHPVQSLTPSSSLEQARALLDRSGFRHIPVVDERDHPVGILSDRDLMRGWPQRTHRAPQDQPIVNPRLVHELMSNELVTASPDTHVRELARVMVTEQIGALPITDEEGVLVGILTTTDLLRAIISGPPLDLWI